MLRWLRRLYGGSTGFHDAHDPPPEEHRFTLWPGESLAQIRFSPHGYEFWFAFHNPADGPTEVEARGPFDPAPHRHTLDHRLPIEAAIDWAQVHDYALRSRPEARYGTLLLTARAGREDLQVLYFRTARTSLTEDPVNRLLNACFAAASENDKAPPPSGR